MSFTVDIADEIWNAFVDAYECKRGTTSTTYNELQNETCKVMRDAIKAYAMSSKGRTLFTVLNKEQWEQFKEDWQIRAARISPLSDEEAEEHARQLMFDALTVPFEKAYERDMTLLVEAYEMALNCPEIHIKKLANDRYGQSTWDIEAPNGYSVHVRGASDLLREVKVAKEYVEKLKTKRDCSSDTSVMIPVHGWIWHNFKWEYTKRNKGKPKTDDELMEIVHDWTCRAMQYYSRYNMEDPWTLAETSKMALEAYEIASDCPGIHIRKDRGVWIVNALHMFDTEAKNAAELLRMVKGAKKYIETSEAVKQEPRVHHTVKEVIDEAMEIAKSVPAMVVKKVKIPGYSSAPVWSISFADNDYTAEARGAAHLVEKVKEAKDYWEASQKSKGNQAPRDIIREAMEKAKKSNDEIIRIDGLDHETKELLLHFIESLTIKDASDILARDYPCSVWDELHFIRERLRKSIAQPRSES